MIINHNMNALNAWRNMSANNVNAGKSMEKLSSGLRINRAGDDAAGLAISEKMRGQIRGLDQAGRNAQDGISMLQTAEGALNESHSILQRMRELAVQGASDGNDQDSRTSIQTEMDQLTSELNRIGNTTEFNTQKLLNGGRGVASSVAVANTQAPNLGTAVGVVGDVSVKTSYDAGTAGIYTIGVSGTSEQLGQYSFTLDVANIEADDTIQIDDQTYTAGGVGLTDFAVGASGGVTMDNLVKAINGNAASKFSAVDDGNGKLILTQKAAGATAISAPTVTATDDNAASKALGTVGALAVTEDKASSVASIATGDTFTIGGEDYIVDTDFALDSTSFDNTMINLASAINAKSSSAFTAAYNAGTLTITEKVASGATDTLTGANTITDSDATVGAPAITNGGSVEAATKAEFDFTIDENFAEGESVTVAGRTYTAVTGTADASSAQFSIDGDTSAVAASLVAAIAADASNAYTAANTGATITLTQDAAADPAGTMPSVTVGANSQTFGQYTFAIDSTPVAAGGSYTIDGVEIKVVDAASALNSDITSGKAVLATSSASTMAQQLRTAIDSNSDLANYSVNLAEVGTTITLTQAGPTPSLTGPTISKLSGAEKFSSTLQIGANEGQSFTVEINDMRAAALKVSGTAGGLITTQNSDQRDVTANYTTGNTVTNGTTNSTTEAALDISSHDKATAAVQVIDDAINNVSAERSKLGAYQNRLEHTIANLGTASENLTSAESRVRDVDMAKEMMAFSKNNILSQAAQAMLAQANQQPQGVLQLLR